jgi:endonuclease G, mitochondrial
MTSQLGHDRHWTHQATQTVKFSLFTTLVGISSLLLACQSTQVMISPHLFLGNPSNAATDLNQPTNYLMVKPQFVLSYNRDRAIPNWVSWQLNSSWIGDVPRQNSFRGDPDLPKAWPQITSADYRGKYDRGHMTPAADRSRSLEDNIATFVLTNIMPQVAANNRGPWEDLESYCRTLVKQGKELYIIAGGAGQAGLLNGKIAIPASTWKVVVIIDSPTSPPNISSITTKTRVLAVNMPNDDSVLKTGWQTYVTTIDKLESLTGHDFLSTVPKAIQDVIEAKPGL